MLGQTNIVSMFQTCHFKASCMLRVKSGKSEHGFVVTSRLVLKATVLRSRPDLFNSEAAILFRPRAWALRFITLTKSGLRKS